VPFKTSGVPDPKKGKKLQRVFAEKLREWIKNLLKKEWEN